MNDTLQSVVFGLVGVLIGFLASFAIFRARFVAIEKDVQYLREELQRFRASIENDDDRKQQAERREREMLLILASVARQLGVSNRVTDLGKYAEGEKGA